MALLLFAPFLFGGRVLWSQDIGRVYYPVASLLRETLRTGDTSRLFWCPELGAGFPLAADGVTTPFYPPHWPLLVLLHPALALTAALFAAYLASGLAMAAFVRTLGLGPLPPPWPVSSTRGAALPSATRCTSTWSPACPFFP